MVVVVVVVYLLAMSHAPPGATCNKTLQKKWDSMKFSAHRDKVRSIRPTVDTRQPPAFLHIRQKAKKIQMGREREEQITRHNRELASRMHHIMISTGAGYNTGEYQY